MPIRNPMKKNAIFIIIFSFLLLGFFSCNNREPYKPDTTLVAGYVIGKETCNTDETKDYWLVDLTYRPSTPQYGDTLFYNGHYYTNVVKTKGLNDKVKRIGIPIDIEFKTITTYKVKTTGCDINDSITYDLKEIFIINIGEIH